MASSFHQLSERQDQVSCQHLSQLHRYTDRCLYVCVTCRLSSDSVTPIDRGRCGSDTCNKTHWVIWQVRVYLVSGGENRQDHSSCLSSVSEQEISANWTKILRLTHLWSFRLKKGERIFPVSTNMVSGDSLQTFNDTKHIRRQFGQK